MDLSTDAADVAAPGSDVIDVLLAQHREIEAALIRVEDVPPDARRSALRTLAELIQRHESTEADVVRPLTRRFLSDGEAVAHARFVEEDQISELLERLSAMDPTDQRFVGAFAVFRDVYGCHLHREEAEEFRPLRDRVDRQELVSRGVAAQRLSSY
jgi:Hemerythrin HHE cation binding domain